MSDPKRIVFAGTPEFSVPPLHALLDSPHELVGVYSQPDRPAGRGRKLKPGPVKQVALDAGLVVHQPANFRNPDAIRQLQTLSPDLMVVVAYGLLLPRAVLDIPRIDCVNIHASLLPRWRGAAPIQRAVLAGDSSSGISIMQMEEGLDTGPIYLVEETPLAPDETGSSLHDRLSGLGATALMKALPGILDGSLVPAAQEEAQTCYARKLDKAEAWIDWSRPAAEIERQVRAFNPWPIAQTRWNDLNLRIWRARAVDGLGDGFGTVDSATRDGIDVGTGDGLLRITELQLPGKRALGAADFVNAHPILGAVLG